MKTLSLMVLLALLLGCSPAIVGPDLPEQIVGPENHQLVLDGVS